MLQNFKIFYRSTSLRYWKNLFFRKKITSKKIIFIHLPKTSGRYLGKIFKQFKLNKDIQTNSHQIKIFQLKKNNKYIISIRDPFSRIISAFYDSKRLYKSGKLVGPLYDYIFLNYINFNELCEAIYNNNKDKNIHINNFFYLTHHIVTGYSYFYFNTNPRVYNPYFIFEHETLYTDVKFFLKKMHISYKGDLPSIKNLKYDKSLSSLSKKNLKLFFGNDEFEIYEYLKKNKNKINSNFIR
jgi:hypothetical protein